jgi:hypothetical protein
VYVTVPLPFPGPDVMLIKESFVVAFHVQPTPVVTLKLPFPPFAEKLALVGDSEKVQPLACSIVKV